MANWSADANLAVGVQGLPYALPFALGPNTSASQNFGADSATQAVTVPGMEQSTVTFDAAGVGANSGAGTTTSLSWSHTATAGADVFAFFTRSAGGGNLVSCTYDGAAMSMVGSISVNNDPNTATMWVYRKSNVAAGTKTVVATWTGAAYASANSVSYLNVGGVDALDQSVAYGSALTATETVTGTTDAIILNAQTHYMGGVDTFVSSSGGTQRSQILPSTKYMNLVIQDSTPAVNYSTTGGGTTARTARSNMTWTHTATLAGETVLVWVETNTGEYVTAGTYGGNAMTNLGSVDTQDGHRTLTLLVAYSVAAGASTVSVTKNSAVHSMQGNSVGYANVASVDSFASTTGVGTVASIGVTPSSGQMAVACLLHYYTNPYTSTTGGTTRWNNAGAACQAIFDSPTPDTFTGTEPTAGRNWVGISVILTPVSTLSPTFTSTVTATNTNWGSLSLVISPAKPTATHVKTVELLSMGNGNAATATSMSWTHDIESDANLLIVAINWLSTAWYPTCTVGGLSMTEVPSAPITFAASLGYYGVVTFYYYRNPPAGTQTITYQGSPGAAYMEANSFTFRGAGGLGTCAKSANASTTVSGGPNDFFLNIFGGWINANGGFSGYNQNPLWSNIGSEAALIGYAKGPSATFSITQLYGSYGGYGSTVLPIQPMVDIIADSSLSVTASMTAEMTKNLFLDADLTTWAGETFPYILPILLGSPTADLFLVKGFFITSVFTVSLDGTIVRNVGVSAALVITTSSTATLRWAAHADLFTLAITATPTAAATRSLSIDAALAVIASAEIIPSTSHPADSSLSVTAVVSSTANVDFLIDAPKQITASLTSTGKRGQYLDAPLPVTATITDVVKWAAKFQASLAVTANRDITGTRNAIVNAPLGITATRDQYLFQTEQFDVLLVTTAGLYVLFTINLYGDADLAVTATPLVEMTRISYAAAALDISTDLPLEATRDQYVEANLDVQDSTESAVNWDSLAEATLVATAEIPALLNQGFLVSVFLDVSAETSTEMLLEALLDALLLTESLSLTAEGIRDQYAEALQQVMFSTTDETLWNIKMEAVLVVPVSVLADGGSAPISSNFFVFYL